jgi:hypothetical protein
MTEIQKQALKIMSDRNAGAVRPDSNDDWIQIEDIRQDEAKAAAVVAYYTKFMEARK